MDIAGAIIIPIREMAYSVFVQVTKGFLGMNSLKQGKTQNKILIKINIVK